MNEKFNYYRGATTGDVYRSKPSLDGTEFFNGQEWVSLTGSDREMHENPDMFELLPGEPAEVAA